MILVRKGHAEYADRFAELYSDAFGPDATRRFRGDGAMALFGLDPGTGKNRERLLAFYERHKFQERYGMAHPTWWREG